MMVDITFTGLCNLRTLKGHRKGTLSHCLEPSAEPPWAPPGPAAGVQVMDDLFTHLLRAEIRAPNVESASSFTLFAMVTNTHKEKDNWIF